MLIYKIAEEGQWAEAVARGAFDGSVDDTRDGFIHLSTAAQARETAAKHFAGRAGLILAAVQVDRLGAQLKWESSRGGALFPHVYGALPMTAVLWARPLPVGADGHHAFPDEVV
jgi:uncharacterized protein (DUF952 family)